MSNAYGMRRKKILPIMAVIFALLFVLAAAAGMYSHGRIRKGISIEQTDVSLMTPEEAKKAVSENMAGFRAVDGITLSDGGREWKIKLDDIGYEYMVDNAVMQAYNTGREGNIFLKAYNSLAVLMNGFRVEVEEKYDRDKLAEILKRIKKDCDSPGKNAGLIYDDGKIAFVREKNKKTLDIEESLKVIEARLKERNFGVVGLVTEEEKPGITYERIKEINGIISRFSTKFNVNDANRTDNIKLACSRIDGTILLPGESFSMNNALGPRTRENGYKEAPIIFKSELVSGTGGGVCQVSSTLYNTVLLAGLDVIEREHHSMPLSYISPGRDATINEGAIDFRFVNNLDYPICLKACVGGNKLEISILGRKGKDDVEYRLKTDIIGVYSPGPEEIVVDGSLPPGTKVVERKATNGLRVVLYREAYRNGKLLWGEKLTEDYYKPVRAKARVSADLYTQRSSASAGGHSGGAGNMGIMD